MGVLELKWGEEDIHEEGGKWPKMRGLELEQGKEGLGMGGGWQRSCTSVGPLEQTTADLGASHTRNLLSPRSEGQRSEIKMFAGQCHSQIL